MEEVGIVSRTDGVMATVVVERKSACDQCRQGCRVSDSGAEIEALNVARASVGQTVRVKMKPYTYLKGSILVYGFPALALILGAVAGREWLPVLVPSVDRDLLSAFCGFLALLVSFVLVKAATSRAEKRTEYKPVIEEIIG